MDRDKTYAIIGIVLLAVIVAGMYLSVIINTPFPPVPEPDIHRYTYDFDNGTLDGWAIEGRELTDPSVNWSITSYTNDTNMTINDVNLTLTTYNDSLYSVIYYLENNNGMGKIWLEHNYSFKANTTYNVVISYKMGTNVAEGFTTVAWILTNITYAHPIPLDQVIFSAQEPLGTADPNATGSELIWMNKSYTFSFTTDESGDAYVLIGLWGVWDTSLLATLDDVEIYAVEYI